MTLGFATFRGRVRALCCLVGFHAWREVLRNAIGEYGKQGGGRCGCRVDGTIERCAGCGLARIVPANGKLRPVEIEV